MGAAVVDSVAISFHALNVFGATNCKLCTAKYLLEQQLLANSYVLQQQSCLTREKALWGGY